MRPGISNASPSSSRRRSEVCGSARAKSNFCQLLRLSFGGVYSADHDRELCRLARSILPRPAILRWHPCLSQRLGEFLSRSLFSAMGFELDQVVQMLHFAPIWVKVESVEGNGLARSEATCRSCSVALASALRSTFALFAVLRAGTFWETRFNSLRRVRRYPRTRRRRRAAWR